MPFARCGDADIAYDDQGEGDSLLLIMGFAADARMWILQLPALSKHYRCVSFDNRGSGRSALPGGACTMDDMAADALGVLDHLGIERAHVLGISMGGAIAQHIALKAPERVRSLVLAATWSRPNPYTDRTAQLGRGILSKLGRDLMAKALMLWVFTPKFLIYNAEFAANVERLIVDFMAEEKGFFAQLDALLHHDVHHRLERLDIPTLVMVGKRDILVPPELSFEIAEAIPGAELKLLETGHAFNVEEMEAFNRTVLDFLGRH